MVLVLHFQVNWLRAALEVRPDCSRVYDKRDLRGWSQPERGACAQEERP
jgi:hypothetical protein